MNVLSYFVPFFEAIVEMPIVLFYFYFAEARRRINDGAGGTLLMELAWLWQRPNNTCARQA